MFPHSFFLHPFLMKIFVFSGSVLIMKASKAHGQVSHLFSISEHGQYYHEARLLQKTEQTGGAKALFSLLELCLHHHSPALSFPNL